MVMGFAGDVMIQPGIRRRQPMPKLLLQPVAYILPSADTSQNGDVNVLRTFHLVDLHRYILYED